MLNEIIILNANRYLDSGAHRGVIPEWVGIEVGVQVDEAPGNASNLLEPPLEIKLWWGIAPCTCGVTMRPVASISFRPAP